MNTLYKKAILVLTVLIALGCEDVITVNAPIAPPRLVIEASLNWYKGTLGNYQFIKLSQSVPYFDTQILPASDAEVTVTDSSNNTFLFTESENKGIYLTYNFIPKIDETYTLTIKYQNETYIGTEQLKSVTPIIRVAQENDQGFSGDETELKAYYQDPENEKNFYFFEFIIDKNLLIDLEVYNDEFTNGNEIFGFFSNDDLNPGDEVIIRNYGVSQRYYEFLFLLLQQKNDDSGGPFETQPASIRGNCVNVTNPDNYPFGYFRASEVDQYNYIIQ